MNGTDYNEFMNAPAIHEEIDDFVKNHDVEYHEDAHGNDAGFELVRDDGEVFRFNINYTIEDLEGNGVMKFYSHLGFYNSETGDEPNLIPTEVF